MEYCRWRAVIEARQSTHTEPVVYDQYSSAKMHILVEFHCETLKNWVNYGDDGQLQIVRRELDREAAITRLTCFDYAADDDDLKQLVLEELQNFDLRDVMKLKEKLADKVIYQARKLGSTGLERFSLVVDITRFLYYIVRESVYSVKMVPASTEAILLLPKKEMNYKNRGDEVESCTVCLEDIPTGVEVSTLPCLHIFHSNCISEWLKRSHYCPICRFEMPIAMN
ncbi:RING-type domain-containing protein [Abeliophyllum distichum]|uniref:RING-type domain-containing protein n=1 Tax=Abeliophyllum distichum TaxID=126358 RepID=A0ABD1R848_9LAMI